MIGSLFGTIGGTAVAVDIGTSSIKVLEISNIKKDPRLVNFAMASLPSEAIVDGAVNDPGIITETLKNLLKQAKIRNKRVITSISGKSAIVKSIRVAKMSEEQLKSQIALEAENYIPFEINDVNLSWQIIDTASADGSNTMGVLLVAAKKDTINQHLQVLTAAGLEPEVIDVDTFAVFNAYEYNYGFEDSANVALVNIGASITNVNIVRAGIPYFTRDVAMGGNNITREMQKSLNLQFEQAEKMKVGGEEMELIKTTGEENLETATPMVEVHPTVSGALGELVNEVNLAFDWFKGNTQGESISKIALVGGGALLKNIDAYFSQAFKIKSEVANPLSKIKNKRADLEAIAPMLSIGVGLAMRQSA